MLGYFKESSFFYVCVMVNCVSHIAFAISSFAFGWSNCELLLVFFYGLNMFCFVVLCFVHEILSLVWFLFSDLLPFRVCFLRCNRFDIKLLACLQINLQNEFWPKKMKNKNKMERKMVFGSPVQCTFTKHTLDKLAHTNTHKWKKLQSCRRKRGRRAKKNTRYTKCF